MKITMEQLESLFYGENTLKDVLPALKEELDRADYYNETMINNLIDNAEEIKRASNEIDGLYARLFKAWSFADGALDVMEPRLKAKIKAKAETDGVKMTDGAVSAQAADEVSMYRRIRAYLFGYTETLNRSLFTLSAILKYEGSPKGVSRPNQRNYQEEPEYPNT
jgi:hypothetical protein